MGSSVGPYLKKKNICLWGIEEINFSNWLNIRSEIWRRSLNSFSNSRKHPQEFRFTNHFRRNELQHGFFLDILANDT